MNETLPKSAEEMSDILDIESLPPSLWALAFDALKIAGLVALILVALYLLYRLFHYLRKRRHPELAPYDRVLADLKRIEGRLNEASTAWPDYYFELTHALKRYLQNEPALDALDKTTEEIRREQASYRRVLGDREWQRLLEFLSKSDGIKFAQGAVTAEEAGRDLAWIRALVTDVHERILAERKEAKS